MSTAAELANIISIRNHLSLLLNGTRNVIKKTEVSTIGGLIQKLDTEIIKSSLELFKDKTIPNEDDVDIGKKVAEAKAKMAQNKTSVKPVEDSKVVKTRKIKKPAPKGPMSEEDMEDDS